MNHVFVDYENVHQLDHSVIGTKAVCFTLLMGAKQTKVDAVVMERIMERAASVQLVRLTTTGKNALDFTIAYYVGRAVITDPTGYFHIVSRDKGYDPLIEHLRSRHIRAYRHDDFSTVTLSGHPKPPTTAPATPPPATPPPATPPPVAPPPAAPPPKASAKVSSKSPTIAQSKPQSKPPADLMTQALAHLRKNNTNRPKRKKTLLSHLRDLKGKKATDADALGLVEKLCKAGHISIGDNDAVTYHL